MTSFNVVIEETAKAKVIDKIDSYLADKVISKTIADGVKAIVNSQKGTLVSIAFNGNDTDGIMYVSWQSHSDERDVPNDKERMTPNEAGVDRDGVFHPEWEGMRTAMMKERLKREPRM